MCKWYVHHLSIPVMLSITQFFQQRALIQHSCHLVFVAFVDRRSPTRSHFTGIQGYIPEQSRTCVKFVWRVLPERIIWPSMSSHTQVSDHTNVTSAANTSVQSAMSNFNITNHVQVTCINLSWNEKQNIMILEIVRFQYSKAITGNTDSIIVMIQESPLATTSSTALSCKNNGRIKQSFQTCISFSGDLKVFSVDCWVHIQQVLCLKSVCHLK